MRFCVAFVVLAWVACAAAINIDNALFSVQSAIPGLSAQAITFKPNGDLVIAQGGGGCLYTFPNAANLPQNHTLSTADSNGCVNIPDITNFVSSQQGNIYTVHGFQLNTVTGQLTRKWNDCGASHGIAVDPRDGAIFVSDVFSTQKIFRIPNPDLVSGQMNIPCATQEYFSVGALSPRSGVDGLTIGPDGTVFGAAWQAGRLLVVSPYSTQSPKGHLISYAQNTHGKPDGISICFGNGTNYAVTANQAASTITQWILDSANVPSPDTLIADTVGGYLDFTAVDPHGCIWGVAEGFVYRVMNADGSCGCNSPQLPSSPETCLACPDANTAHVHYEADVNQYAESVSAGKCATLAFDV